MDAFHYITIFLGSFCGVLIAHYLLNRNDRR